MEFKFGNDNDEQEAAAPAPPKKNQNALVLLLLLLVGGFVYIYFFSGLLKSEEKPSQAAVSSSPVVKMPLPAREGAAKITDAPPAGQKAAPIPVPPASTQPAPAVVVAKASPPAPVTPHEAIKKTEPVKIVEKKPLPVPAVEKKAPIIAAAPAGDKAGGVEKKAAASSKGTWFVLVGRYTLEEELSKDIGHVRKAGFEPVVTAGLRKQKNMSRLLFSETDNPADARVALDKLRGITSDGFIIEQGGRHAVYAGSYLLADRATAEKARLAAAGIAVTIKHARIALGTKSLSAGPFTSKKSAEAAVSALKKVGLKAALIKK